jgi:DNA processing protein
MHTVTEAERRDRPVLAVPGPVRSPASAGTNRLIAEGAGVARDTDDVLVALGLSPGSRRRAAEHRSQPVGTEATVLEAIGWQPASLDQLLERSAVALGALMEALTRLEARGWVAVRGGWYERVVRETAS